MKITAGMIVKNEEATILDCLERLKGFDEIVIIDTGSTDGTVELARSAGAVVHTDYAWNDDFAEARNQIAQHASGDWILHIDADNLLMTPIEAVRELVDEASLAGHKTANIRATYPTGQWHWVSGLCRRHRSVKWVGRVHECISPAPTFNANIAILVGSSPNKASDPDRNLRILLKSDLSVARTQFYLGKEYHERGQHMGAIAWMKAYLENPGAWWVETAWACLILAYSYNALGNNEKAREWCLQSINHNAECREALMLMGNLTASPWKEKWLRLATLANNEHVLFVR